MEIETIKKLAKEALEDSINHGYEDHRKPVSRICTKAICEVAEAVSAYRDNRMASIRGFIRSNQINDKQPEHPSYDDNFVTNYRTRVKDTVQDEMTDVVIYMLVLIASFDEKQYKIDSGTDIVRFPQSNDFIYSAGNLITIINFIPASPDPIASAIRVIAFIESWMHVVTGDDLEWMLRYKMRFNKLRPYRHGRKDDPTI